MRKKLHLPSRKFVYTLGVCGLVAVSGCSIRGTYVDAVGPDTAKLRFIARADNATLDYFDADNCQGKTTGLLNNLFTRDTSRRVGMGALPSKDAYLEINIEAGRDIVLSLNTLGMLGFSCPLAVSLNAQKGAEYELFFRSHGRRCYASLAQLHVRNGMTVLSTEPIVEARSFPACAGRGPQFLNPKK